MIIWTGFGILLPVVFLLGLVLPTLADSYLSSLGFSLSNEWKFAIGCVLGTCFSWVLSATIAKTKVMTLLDPKTHKPVHLKKTHALFFIPIRFYCWLLVPFSIFIVAAVATGNLDEFRPSKRLHKNDQSGAGKSTYTPKPTETFVSRSTQLPVTATIHQETTVFSDNGVDHLAPDSRITVTGFQDDRYTVVWNAKKYTIAEADLATATVSK